MGRSWRIGGAGSGASGSVEPPPSLPREEPVDASPRPISHCNWRHRRAVPKPMRDNRLRRQAMNAYSGGSFGEPQGAARLPRFSPSQIVTHGIAGASQRQRPSVAGRSFGKDGGPIVNTPKNHAIDAIEGLTHHRPLWCYGSPSFDEGCLGFGSGSHADLACCGRVRERCDSEPERGCARAGCTRRMRLGSTCSDGSARTARSVAVFARTDVVIP